MRSILRRLSKQAQDRITAKRLAAETLESREMLAGHTMHLFAALASGGAMQEVASSVESSVATDSANNSLDLDLGSVSTPTSSQPIVVVDSGTSSSGPAADGTDPIDANAESDPIANLAEGEDGLQVVFRPEVTDLAGNVITNAQVGDDVRLNVYVQDVRDSASNFGVFAPYLDATYDTTKVTRTSGLSFGSEYGDGQTFDLSTAGVLNEVGAIGFGSSLGQAEVLLYSIDFEVDAPGAAVFATDPADNVPVHNVLVLSSNDPVPIEEIDYQSVTLNVGGVLTATNDTASVSQGSTATTIDVLDNDSTTVGSLSITAVGTPSNGGTAQNNGNDISYTPAASFSGVETFTYTISDGQGQTAQAQVSITVTPTQTMDDIDLIGLANQIAATDTKFYGAYWNSDTESQRELFAEGADFLPYVESWKFDSAPDDVDGFTQEALDANIDDLPTWVFGDGSRLTGVQSLEVIAQRSGVTIPMTSDPQLVPINDTITVRAGAPLHIPLDGFDPNGEPLTFTAVSSDTSIVETFIPDNNRSLRFDISGFGDLTFELFEGRAPDVTARIIELAQQGFYDGVVFHRVIDNFVIQGGDPDGDGGGGSGVEFDDMFHPDLQHTSTGLLSMAKTATDDTNDSQFFVTEIDNSELAVSERQLRSLDFNHMVFGLLTEGETSRQAISELSVDSDDRPDNHDVTILSTEVFNDTENAVLMLKAPDDMVTGTTTVTVTVMDSAGATFEQTFTVNVVADEFNGTPYLEPFDSTFEVDVDEAVTIDLEAFDIEGDAFEFRAEPLNGSNPFALEIDEQTGVVTATPEAGFTGKLEFFVGVRQSADVPVDTVSTFDTQLVTVFVGENATAPFAPDLLPADDSGESDTDNITNATTLTFQVRNTTDQADVQLRVNGQSFGNAIAVGPNAIVRGDFSSLGDGTYDVIAVQVIDGTESVASEATTITIDTTVPALITPSIPTSGLVGEPFEYNAEHEEEGTGLVYTIREGTAPEGMTINPETGVLSWTPTADDLGLVFFDLEATDLAGNFSSLPGSLIVSEPEFNVTFTAELMSGTSNVSTAPLGAELTLNVFVEDTREENADGVSEAFTDVEFDSSIVSVGSITFGSDYPDGRTGSTSDGLIDEAGGTTTSSLGSGRTLLFSVPVFADALGQTVFDLKAAATSLGLVGMNGAVAEENVRYVDATLNVVDAVTAGEDTFNVIEDSVDNSLLVLDNDGLGPAGGTIEITAVGTPSQGGTVTFENCVDVNPGDCSVAGRLLYTPAADFAGTETFTYTIVDGLGGSSTANVTVFVENVNDLPVATDDEFTTMEDTFLALDVFSNDAANPDEGETLTITNISTPTGGGTAAVAANDPTTINYLPAFDFSGTETFTYDIEDGNGGAVTVNATITVTSVNDAPSTGDDMFTLDEDSTLTINVADVLSNDSAGPADESGQTLTITGVDSTDGATVMLSGDTITYTPAADFSGSTSFTYTVEDDGTSDGNADPQSSTGTVNLTVVAVNDPPNAVNDSASLREGATIDIDVLDNDSTADVGETLTIASTTAGSRGGNISIINNGTLIRYTPLTGVTGTETFDYTISDGNGSNATATVTVTIDANAAPVANPDTGQAVQNGSAITIDVLANDTTEADETLTISGVTQGVGGLATISNGQIVYTPAADFFGTDTFNYTVSDGNGGTDTATVTVTVEEFVAESVTGSIYIDSNQNGVRDVEDSGVSGIEIRLTGNDVDGVFVDRSVFTDRDGNYEFSDILPGDYMVEQLPSDFLLTSPSSSQQVPVTVDGTGGANVGSDFTSVGLHPRYAIWNALASGGGAGFMGTASAQGGSALSVADNSWDQFDAIGLSLSADGSTLTINARTGSTNFQATVSTNDRSRVQIIGEEGGTMLVRLLGTANDYAFSQSSVSSAAATDAAFGN